jgi:hypothetical protein
MLARLHERDLKMISIDRNVSEALRQLSKKMLTKAKLG